MSNSLAPDQAQHFVGSDLGPPNCLQRLSADNTSRKRIKAIPKNCSRKHFQFLMFKFSCISKKLNGPEFEVWLFIPKVSIKVSDGSAVAQW